MKSKKKLKHKVSRPFIPKWKVFRSSDPLLSVFMWGINHTVSELNHQLPVRLLMPDDFKAFSKIKIDNHLFNKESMPSHFKVKEYCPNVFRSLREKFGVEEGDYLKSLTKNEPLPLDAHGRSNARLFTSYDMCFVIKTIDAEEVAEVHSILQKYHNYVVEQRSRTLLPQYVGMYRLTVEGAEVYAVVMRNVFSRNYPISKKYDLKGSTVQRQASEKERAKEFPTYKDIDFLEEKCKLYLSKRSRQRLIEMLTSDTDFLASLNLMDYSLLVGIHELDSAPAASTGETSTKQTAATTSACRGDSSEVENGSDESNDYGSQPTPPESPPPCLGAFAPFSGNEELQVDDEFYAVPARCDAPKKMIYFIGLIDILTYYGMKKLTATAAKAVKYGAEAEISTVRPQQYAKRLVEFVTRALDNGDNASTVQSPSAGGGDTLIAEEQEEGES
ncbi:phosphatidylinositol 5 phosphate 4 kinase type 2 [Trichuris trichiura]|uniref:1-phosphatidylinositol-5-phosphate 4-kinase n=1 Tax=Trichuris trichiura TaxID=36087 RepID=A0A077ZAU0_TRITR|nr:phosphatidylinositol 5 phosphate 4 kinase type 2 [Trichuris trichiura]